MTVKELIEKLSGINESLPVLAEDEGRDYMLSTVTVEETGGSVYGPSGSYPVKRVNVGKHAVYLR